MAWGIKVVIKQLVARIWYGVREELTPLMEIPGVKQVCCIKKTITELRRMYSFGVYFMTNLSITIVMVKGRARQLYQAGYTTVAELAAAEPRTLCKETEKLFLNQATDIVRFVYQLCDNDKYSSAESFLLYNSAYCTSHREAKRINKKQARDLLEQADDTA